MHSVTLKSQGPVLLSMKLLLFPVNHNFSQSALVKFNETALRHMVPAVNWRIDSKALFKKTKKNKKMKKYKISSNSTYFFVLFYYKRITHSQTLIQT